MVLAVGDPGLRVTLVVPRFAVRPEDWTVVRVTGTVPVKLLSGPPESETETATLAIVPAVVLTDVGLAAMLKGTFDDSWKSSDGLTLHSERLSWG